MRRDVPELLAPAGSLDTMKAVLAAGADAVYMGGPMFGARAYADNPDMDGLLYAIDYVHVRGKKLYLTVNTLLKDAELRDALYDYLAPLYERGLDAVIVQDLGVLSYIRKTFPDLPVHVSTQMTVTGPESVRMFKEAGATRVVTARELSLEELRAICDVGLEVESFVHGAICYCYSGKCLFSSLAGGRSGNRGRCAQPCRQPYQFSEANSGKVLSSAQHPYLLSLKDMNTLVLLPKILEAGVYSLKIEGRMKKPEYAAGVVSIYRKYLDLYLSGLPYVVEAADQERLADLFNRNGFSIGYYEQKNGKDMMSLDEVSFRSHDLTWQQEIQNRYIRQESHKELRLDVYLHVGEPSCVTVSDGEIFVTVEGEIPQPATGRPLEADNVLRNLKKSGGTDFVIQDVALDLSEQCFLPISAINQMRRNALEAFREELLTAFYREKAEPLPTETTKPTSENEAVCVTARVHSQEQWQACVTETSVSRIWLEAGMAMPQAWAEMVAEAHAAGKEVYYVPEEPFRQEMRSFYDHWWPALLEADFDGIVCDSTESLAYVKNQGWQKLIAGDHSLYVWNREAAVAWRQKGVSGLTAPLEMNFGEWMQLPMEDMEIVVYGRLPMMVTANCLWKSTVGCRKELSAERFGVLRDSEGRRFMVASTCRFCGNVIYNCVPLVLYDQEEMLRRLRAKRLRFWFTTESAEETKRILRGRTTGYKPTEFTRGHWKRGVL